MTVTRVPRLFLLILAELCLAVGGTAEPVYGLIGKEVRLDPKVTGALSSITWKKGKDKIAEWDQKLGRDYYDRCKTEGQCDLSNSTGVLIMKGLKREDEERYFAEINSKGPAKAFQLIVLEPVSKPIVTASCNETQCTLTCVGEETKHTRYSWKENDETVKEGNTLMAEKSGNHSKSYTCVISNPKSEEESDPLTERDLFLYPVSKPSVTTSCNETQCTLTCVGEETKHTRYSWKENNKTVKEGNTLMVEKSGDHSKSYTCVFRSPNSEEDSDPLTERDLFPGFSNNSTIVAGVLVALVAVAVAVAVVVVVIIRTYRRKPCRGRNGEQQEEENELNENHRKD